MRNRSSLFVIIAAVLAMACGNHGTPAVDAALSTDLALASQVQPFGAQQALSPAEVGNVAQQNLAPRTIPSAPRAATPARRTSTARRTNASRSSTARTGGSGYPARATPAEVVVKHTQRDAAIGAVAGAVIGATTSRNKVRGGVIGAAVGGILGGVIGNNVDKERKIPW